jgi:redox-sensitive bicupin YhaK (pirin superfamily)
MIRIRRSADRGHLDYGWLDTHHTFSFGEYDDPAHRGFRQLRVINEDTVAPGVGFPPHGHRDMEILTYVLSGAVEHQDSMGNRAVIRPGEVQRMTAGRGVTHSEMNPSPGEPLHLLQIWIHPDRRGLEPGYEQRPFPAEARRGRLQVVASPDGRDGSLTIHQDASLYAGALAEGDEVEHALAPGRHAWVQVTRGSVSLNGESLEAGDGAALSDEPAARLRGRSDAEVLVFDLA